MDNDLKVLFKEATNLFKEKKYNEARELLEVLVSADYVPAFKMLKSTLVELGETERVEQIDKELKIALENEKSHNNVNVKKTKTNEEDKSKVKKKIVNTHPLSNSENTNSYQNNNSNYHNSNKRIDIEKSVLFNPSNKVWLNIMLYTFIVFEFIVLISSIFVSIAVNNFLIFLVAVVLIPIIHIGLMLRLNQAFNIQYIKDYLEINGHIK